MSKEPWGGGSAGQLWAASAASRPPCARPAPIQSRAAMPHARPCCPATPAPAGVRLLVYSGTADGVMTTAGTRAWIDALGLPVDGPRRFWSDALAWREVRWGVQRLTALCPAGMLGAAASCSLPVSCRYPP